MPKVYLEKKLEATEDDLVEVHENFVKNKTYKNMESQLKNGMYSYYIPKGKNELYFSSPDLNAYLTVKNQKLINFLKYFGEDDLKKIDLDDFKMHLRPIIDEFSKEFSKFANLNHFDLIKRKSDDKMSIKSVDGNLIMKFSSRSKDYLATNLIILSRNKKGTYVSSYPFIFSNISDIKSTVFSAFPVIFLFVIIIIFLLNRVYSKSLTEPIIKMSNFTRNSKFDKNAKYDLEIKTDDEIEELSDNLKNLYETLTQNYIKLEKNSKRKEIFVKSSSHQLKTPLQAAILLNESMIAKIGKYKDWEKYLPELRKKLYKIQVLIDDLLYMNKLDESILLEDLDLSLIMKESIDNHKDLILDKNIATQIEGQKIAKVDYNYFKVIFDNLIKNAIENTDKNGKISIDFQNQIKIENYPTSISDYDLERLFDPFVSGKKQKSNGMGLYIVKYLLDDMNYDIKLSFKEKTFTVEIKEK
ncbi:MAG: HAMP domain-containing sensor histidine kinase [Peptoniphilaceae bacterium]|nr:HAMP domain-containing sensor histidine kinase [Peptoniphilaceae bacterium]MDY6018684.1 HAMP domain-containing sensor histidine kinase [Anaerococcus sp.]